MFSAAVCFFVTPLRRPIHSASACPRRSFHSLPLGPSGVSRPVQSESAFLFFEPFEYLHCGDHPFRQMRIERAGGDVWRVG
jgi:hypothetical protein